MDDFQERASEMDEQEMADIWEQVKREQARSGDNPPKAEIGEKPPKELV